MYALDLHNMLSCFCYIVHLLFSTVLQNILLPSVRKAVQRFASSTLSEIEVFHENRGKQPKQQCHHGARETLER